MSNPPGLRQLRISGAGGAAIAAYCLISRILPGGFIKETGWHEPIGQKGVPTKWANLS